MSLSLTRRLFIGSALGLPVLPAAWMSASAADATPAPAPSAGGIEARLASLEAKSGGRLGVAALDTATNRRIGHRADERFPMCSTFKFLAATFVLARVDRGTEQLDRRIAFAQKDLIRYSPITEKRAGPPGMTLAELCEAAVTVSDNTAANAILGSFGGPTALTAYVRSLGDSVTRLDRLEPDLNEAAPGDPRDTTSPSAMVENLQRIVLGNVLSQPSRERLTAWLVACKTGDERLRAGLPATWRVGDKTGSGTGTTNDVAIVWPPDRAPILIATYLTGSKASDDDRNAVLSDVARTIAAV